MCRGVGEGSTTSVRMFALVAAALVVATPTSVALLGSSAEQSFVVGFKRGELGAVTSLVALAGGTVQKGSSSSGLLVATSASSSFVSSLLASPLVGFVETNDRVGSNGVEWNGVQWNGVQWNGVQWNGVEWNGAEWNGAEWNGAGEPTGADPGTGFQWGLERVNASGAWSVSEGKRSATLCTVDSGIDATHPDVAPNVWRSSSGAHGWNAITGTSDVRDDGGHGTHMATVAAAAVRNGYGIAGMGNVRVMAVKALDATGAGLEGDVALGISWCADNGAKVILLALSSSPSPAMDRAIKYARERDALVVGSAGNGGPCSDCVSYPASNPQVIAVGAIARDGSVAAFSNRGAKVELSAPGVDIAGALPDERFAYGSGTSQAAAFVAGAAALLRDANPALTSKDARAILAGTARDAGTPGRDTGYGIGVLDAGRALAAGGR